MRTPARAIGLLALVALLGACADEPGPAIDLELVQDLNINTAESVLERVETVRLVVDGPEGLYPPGAERGSGAVRIVDADGDPSDLELVAEVAVEGDRLPLIRLERGSLPEGPLDLALQGLGDDDDAGVAELEAEGGVRGVRFEGGVTTLAVPFNLRPERLPPRVTEVVPGDGDEIAFCDVEALAVVFSEPVDEQSLLASTRVQVEPNGVAAVRLDATGLVAHVVLERSLEDDEADTVTFELVVSSDVVDLQGQRLDQVPAEPGPQPFDEAVTLRCRQLVTGPRPPCGGEPWPPCPPLDRLQCVDGVCQPVSCDGARCPDGFLCAPDLGRCEVDCRLYGAGGGCPLERPLCDAETGLCG
jgi:hypothetical protein